MFYYLTKWTRRGIIDEVNASMVEHSRWSTSRTDGRPTEVQPSAAVIDSQAVKSGVRGRREALRFAGEKCVNGVKRVNGGQCISCGNCSTYCETGIDVRTYAQKGQDTVRSSCVGWGVCAAVCPRGVLRLENGSDTNGHRADAKRVIHVGFEEVGVP